MSNNELIERVFAGDPRSIARAITKIESGTDGAAELMKAVFPKTGNATVIGITGSPGAGKSSLLRINAVQPAPKFVVRSRDCVYKTNRA